jgi:hypothetical protein
MQPAGIRKKFLLTLLLMAFAASAQPAESTGADFLLAAPHARTAALNSAFSALADDENAVLFNPAGLPAIAGTTISFTHFASFVDTNYEYVCFAVPLGKLAAGGSILYAYTYNFNWITGADENRGAVNNYDFLATVSAGYAVLPDFSAGASVKFFRSEILTYFKYGLAFDAGLRMVLARNPGVYIAFVLQNAGWQTAYERIADAMPVCFRIGMGIKIKAADFLDIEGDIDISRLISSGESSDVGMGIEFGFYDILYAGAGFGLKNSGDNFSIGAGIKPIKQAKISYAFQPFEGLGLTHRISLDVYL